MVCSMADLQVSYSETLAAVNPRLSDMSEQDVDALSDEAVLAMLANSEDGEVGSIVRDLSMIEGMLDNLEGTSNALEDKLHDLLREFQGLRQTVAAAAAEPEDDEVDDTQTEATGKDTA